MHDSSDLDQPDDRTQRLKFDEKLFGEDKEVLSQLKTSGQIDWRLNTLFEQLHLRDPNPLPSARSNKPSEPSVDSHLP